MSSETHATIHVEQDESLPEVLSRLRGRKALVGRHRADDPVAVSEVGRVEGERCAMRPHRRSTGPVDALAVEENVMGG